VLSQLRLPFEIPDQGFSNLDRQAFSEFLLVSLNIWLFRLSCIIPQKVFASNNSERFQYFELAYRQLAIENIRKLAI
jgi:hypothetical protein